MPASLPIEAAGSELRTRLERLPRGETLNIVGPDGQPVAVVVSLRPVAQEVVSPSEWIAEWKALAEDIGRAWRSDKSALEVLSEMRR